MKELKLTITIDSPAQEVFDFTLDPANTPRWIDDIVIEETDETPTKLGTLYRNQDREGSWREYEITAFDAGKMFVLSRKDGSFHVRYTLKPLGDASCELEYHEWVDSGELTEPFEAASLEKLKRIIEQPTDN